MRNRNEQTRSRVRLTAGAALCLILVCSTHEVWADIPPAIASEILGNVSDAPLRDFQLRLLDIALEAASEIPIQPHIKDRSRSQEAVVLACLELDQPGRAIRYTDRIDNWRRGSCYADIAFHLARQGDVESAEHCLELAERLSEVAEDWRKDRVHTKIAKTRAWLGEMEEARDLEEGVAESEFGKVALAEAMKGDQSSMEEQISALEPELESGNFDLVKNALSVCTKIYTRFYEDPMKRSAVEAKIKSTWSPMPIFIRIELLTGMVESALEHSDQETALRLVNETQVLVDEHQWPLEHGLPIKAKVVELRFRAGDETTARREADELLRQFEEHKEEIVNIYRAEALHPLARAYQAMGETGVALNVYKRAVEEGVENPNSRPRAEDLSATCCEMARWSIEPDQELWDRIEEIEQGLDAPW
ncbi:MAG: hypothetical protein KC917_10795 [Candidatus Omnitrophica bacterium]|nr:hypothetical protein [Candidatus Omnitrophota bacterium]